MYLLKHKGSHVELLAKIYELAWILFVLQHKGSVHWLWDPAVGIQQGPQPVGRELSGDEASRKKPKAENTVYNTLAKVLCLYSGNALTKEYTSLQYYLGTAFTNIAPINPLYTKKITNI